MNMKHLFVAFSLLATFSCNRPSTASSTKEAWNQTNDPIILGVPSRQIDTIPMQTTLDPQRVTWSGYYWPTFKGGISDRWQQPNRGTTYADYQYATLSPSALSGIDANLAAQLSPSEKYDLWMGRYDFPLTQLAKNETFSAISGNDVPHWNGICHGWAAASIMEPQPGDQASVRSALNGLPITFYASDIEALLSRAYSNLEQVNFHMVGGRCDRTSLTYDQYGRSVDPECRDTNPGAVHLILGDYIGQQGRALIADISNDDQVWNQPVFGYTFQYSNRRALTPADNLFNVRAAGTVTLVDVNLTLDYADEIAPRRSRGQLATDTLDIQYTLELDANDRIIGGEWLSQDRLDFLWVVDGPPQTQAQDLLDLRALRYLNDLSRGVTLVNPVNPPPPVVPTPNPGTPPGQGPLLIQSFDARRGPGGFDMFVEIYATARLPWGTAVLSVENRNGFRTVIGQQSVRAGADVRFQARIRNEIGHRVILEVVDPEGQVVGYYLKDI